MKDIKVGMANVFIQVLQRHCRRTPCCSPFPFAQQAELPCDAPHWQHTSASLTINENADPDVREDMETFLNGITPEASFEAVLPDLVTAPLRRHVHTRYPELDIK